MRFIGREQIPSSLCLVQVQPLIEELRKGLGANERGEAWFYAQIALLIALLFPPGPLEVRLKIHSAVFK